MKLGIVTFFVGLAISPSVWSQEPEPNPAPQNLLENPGFENGLRGWTSSPENTPLFQAIANAASIGNGGLRAGDPSGGKPLTADLFSARHPATVGKAYRLTYWANGHGGKSSAEVKLEFYGPDNQSINADRMRGFWTGDAIKYQDCFEPYLLQGIAPQGATAVGVHIKATALNFCYADFDDFALVELPPEAAARTPLPPPVPVEPLLAEIKANPTRGASVPQVVIKLDDVNGKGNDRWGKVTELIEQKGIKAGLGVICNSLENGNQAYFERIKTQRASEHFEFWLHGYDHGFHQVGGKLFKEFENLTREEAKQRIALCQQLAKEKLGFAFTSFGPSGGSAVPKGAVVGMAKTPLDDEFLRALEDDPDLKSIMYPCPIDEPGKILRARGKIVVLDRVGTLNIEYPTFCPRYDKFVEGYAHNRGRIYFVIQGHPAMWDEARFAEFAKIVDFLIAQQAIFTTPTELARQVRTRGDSN